MIYNSTGVPSKDDTPAVFFLSFSNPLYPAVGFCESGDCLSGYVTTKKENRPKSARHICRFISLTFPDVSSHNPFCLIRAGLPGRSLHFAQLFPSKTDLSNNDRIPDREGGVSCYKRTFCQLPGLLLLICSLLPV